MKSKEKFIRDKISEDTRKKIENTVERLKSEGYVFEYEETPDEFIIEKEGKRIHITKVSSPDSELLAETIIEDTVKNSSSKI